ncbi:MAG TPA: COX15/CtaA family protein, partial [Planctomycetota bacterium]|nr:COX15/CtaA family protein [Planctomycetota bacterium]
MSGQQGEPQVGQLGRDLAAGAGTAGGGNRYAPFLTLWSLITAAMTLVLIVVGSLVTSDAKLVGNTVQTVGDSIPTWPFGDKMNVEMVHRIVAMTVGVLTLVLAIALAASEPRKWVRRLGYVALLAVICQALLGGARVLLASPDKVDYNSTARIGIAMIHATLAQLIFALSSLIALVTTKGWLESPAPVASPDTRRTRRLGILTCGMVVAQILLGAWARHLRFVPDWRTVAVWVHVAMALSVAVHAVLLAVRTSKKHYALYQIRQT